MVRLNPFAEFYRFLPFHYLKPYTKTTRIDHYRQPPNVNVVPTPLWYIPLDNTYKKLGLKHFEKVEKFLKNSKSSYDFVHSHFTWSAGYVGARLKEKYKIPFIVTAHGFDIYSLPFQDDEWRENIEYVLNTADAIITVSHSNRDCINRLQVTTPVTVIPNGFRNDMFYPSDMHECRRMLNLPRDKKILLCVGYLETDKGHKYLLDAVRIIVKERNDILCVLIGDGMLRTTLERQVHSLGLEKFIMIVGEKRHDEIPCWMNASDIFVLSSLNEGNPTVMFEALGCGIPFVGTSVGGVPEVISSKDYGLLSKPANPQMLAEKIMEALEVQWDRQKIVDYAQRFTWRNIAGEIIKIHQNVAGSSTTKF